jgi:hypothetical protein
MKMIGKKLPADAGSPAPSETAPGSPTPGSPTPGSPTPPSPQVFDIGSPVRPPKLPRGAFLRICKSGGFRFTSTEVVVFRDGRVTRASTDKTAGGELASTPGLKLTAKQVSHLRATIGESDLPGAAKAAAGRNATQPSPDAYAYEIVARVGRRVHSVEVLDGRLPESLKPLIEALNRLSAPPAAP